MAELAKTGRNASSGKILLEFFYLLSNVQNPLEEIYALVLDVDLLIGTEGPETLLKVIVLRGTEAVDIAVCTVVVGDQKTLIGDDASGTAELHRNDSVRNACTRNVGVIDLAGRKLQSTFLHLLLQGGVDSVDHPHSLVRHSAIAAHHGSHSGHYEFLKIFHLIYIPIVISSEVEKSSRL